MFKINSKIHVLNILFRIVIITFLIFPFYGAFPQNGNRSQDIRIMFYNVENLFDVTDDSLTSDEEFTPEGDRRWNQRKMYDKIHGIYKVIMAVGTWEPPAVIGLCEIENRFVLEQLIYETPLNDFGYRIIHHESPDRRGIDVALLYRDEFFLPLHDEAVPVGFPFDTSYVTRDILYVKGLLGGSEMIHIFVNHWPSRYGGYLETIDKRKHVAGILKGKTDSLFAINTGMRVLIMGDFNDDPDDESISRILQAQPVSDSTRPGSLYNLMSCVNDPQKKGSLKYRGNWNTFDQIMVSGALLDEEGQIILKGTKAEIFSPAFLLEKDETYLGEKPFRTYSGFRYHGGFSDHMPVYIDLRIRLD